MVFKIIESSEVELPFKKVQITEQVRQNLMVWEDIEWLEYRRMGQMFGGHFGYSRVGDGLVETE